MCARTSVRVCVRFISDETGMKLPPAVCLYGRCFTVCTALKSTSFNHWHLADTCILIPCCHAAKYWKATRNRGSAYLLCVLKWHCAGGRDRFGWGINRLESIKRKLNQMQPHSWVIEAFQKTVEGEKHLSTTQHANHQAPQFPRTNCKIISLL